jgi:predicted MarR family transcription regulator
MSKDSVTLSEFEYALAMLNNAFERWILSCSFTAGLPDLGPLDIQILHNIHHRDRPKRIMDVAFTLNIEDIHNISYAVRKLVKRGLVASERRGKDTYYRLAESGLKFCDEYHKVREQCLVDDISKLSLGDELGELAAAMRSLSGIYDPASRAVRSL